MNVTIFGVGFVGLTQGAVLAKHGHDVVCVDVDATKINTLIRGELPFFEPKLSEIVLKGHEAGKIVFTTDAEKAVKHGEIIFIAVGTPSSKNGSADLSYVQNVATTIGMYIDRHTLVVNKSTAPIGTVDLVKETIEKSLSERSVKIAFDVISNPEFLREGSAVNDCLNPERVIIGADSEEARDILRDLYLSCAVKADKIFCMKPRSAELTKYAANSMLAAKISMINEISNIAEKYAADIEEIKLGVGSDSRIGFNFINPGPGYGGSCFPKDVRALIKMCKQVDFEPLMLNAIENRNNAQKGLIIEKIYNYFKGDIYEKVFAVWGLSFKANTSDLRESVCHVVINELSRRGVTLKVYDPEAMPEAQKIYAANSKVLFCESKEEAICNADGLIILTEWDEFLISDWSHLRTTMRKQVVFDGRNLYSPLEMQEQGFNYVSIGRASV